MVLAIVLGTMMFALAGSAAARTVWLCKPGQHPDPCTPGLCHDGLLPDPAARAGRPSAARRGSPKIDCFYVYPTVSDQKGPLANLHVDPEERSIALYQAARYSQLCRVFAPMYRQVTVPALEAGNQESPAELATPLADVRRAFADYLQHDNHGRGFVLIGHSQGASMLRLLIAKDVDHKPAVRARMLSAIALGGNVLVKRGRAAGGDFQNVPACRHATELGCVIAFSTYDQPPPANSIFGRTTTPGDQVLCVNPAALVGAPDARSDLPLGAVCARDDHRGRHLPAAPHAADAAHRVELGARRLQRPLLVGRRGRRAADHRPRAARRWPARALIRPGVCICSTPTSSSAICSPWSAARRPRSRS